MTNENQKKNSLKKYKFLVPQIVNLAFIFFVCSVARVNLYVTIVFVMTSILATMFSWFIYKFDFDSEYRKQAIKRIEENKKLPVKYRYRVAGELEIFIVLGAISLILFIVDASIKHQFIAVMIFIALIIAAFAIVKGVKKLFSK